MTELSQGVRTGWEGGTVTRYTVTIRDHGDELKSSVDAPDLQYALAAVLIEARIYLTSAQSITIEPLASDE